ncbi:MAG TPA: hypothetical protein VEG39_10340 [Clostridia bacterium]|nr:hypothetical protein [Clostridia bacterium]
MWKQNRSPQIQGFSRYNPYYSLLLKLNNRLTLINQKSPARNISASFLLLSVLILLGACYFLFAYNTFSGLWYHKVLCVFSTLIFVYLCEQSYFEIYEKRIRKDLPNTLKKLTHYYNHYKGNIIPALEDTISRCPKSNRIYIMKIKEALMKPDYDRQVEELEHKMPTTWFKMLCRLVLFAKENGGTIIEKDNKAPGEDVISNNLKRLTNIVTFLNIEQGYNDAELLGMQVFVFFAPLLVIPVTRWYNASLLIDMNTVDIYGSIQAQNLTAILMFISGIGALFIHWMRKLQN